MMGANGNRKNTEIFKREVFEKTNGECSLVGEYLFSKTLTQIKHNVCKKVFEVKPVNFIRTKKATRCPYCSVAKNKKKTTEQFKQEVELLSNGEYEVVGKYSNNKEKIMFFHKGCKKSFFMKPNHFLDGERCPYCFGNTSKAEEELKKWMEQNLRINVEKKRIQSKNKKKEYEIDLFVPMLNIGFEFNGTYWHSTQVKDKNYHVSKRKACETNNIKLYFLWEHWGENVCKNIIKAIVSKKSLLKIEFPYVFIDRNYLYLNKDIFLKPEKIKGYSFLRESHIKRKVYYKSREFEIYNSGFFKYEKTK